jgi:hypothetical protein
MTARVGSQDRAALDRVPGLVSSRGQEVGVKTEVVQICKAHLPCGAWILTPEAPAYVGDAGNTEAGRSPSKRVGVEMEQPLGHQGSTS